MKLKELFTDAQDKLDEKRVLGWLIAIAGFIYLGLKQDVTGFAAIMGLCAGFLGGAVAADQGK
jgi:hypothetical protein